MNSKQLGDFGEKIAEKYLKKKGYRIVDKNYSSKFISGPKRGEIDIVAKKDNIVSFIEVKTQRDPSSLTSPEDKVNFKKQRKIIKTAENWLMEKKTPLNAKWQIDVISIKVDLTFRKAKIKHFINAILI